MSNPEATHLDCLQDVSEPGSLFTKGVPGYVFGALCGKVFQLLTERFRLTIILSTAKVLQVQSIIIWRV